jgi:hypothetical protein
VITLVTAVLFYFGWRRADVQAQEMSIEVSLFGFSTQDYVLRSISSLYLPLLLLLGIGLAWLAAHARVVRLLRSDALREGSRRATAAAWTRWIAIGATVLAAAVLLFTLATRMRPRPPVVRELVTALQFRQWVVPLVLVIATLTAAYASWLNRQLRPAEAQAASEPTEAPALWQTVVPPVLLTGTVILGGFWMLEEYAASVGRSYAYQLAAGVEEMPRTVVLSPTPLGIEAPGVDEVRLGAVGSPEVRYRTTGLRLLARSGGKVLLVHGGWSPETGTIIVLADRDELGWQFSN